jgi:hypothetical protein
MSDLTYIAVRSQLSAMNCDEYKVGILNRDHKTMVIKNNLSSDSVLNYINFLKHKNVNGHDIYICQENSVDRALILVDDLDSFKIGQMVNRGVNPACVVETSPCNFQVWVSLGQTPMPKSQRKLVAALLAREFGGDLASTDANHFGRLAGFTNRKPCHKTGNGYPFVLCKSHSGAHADKSSEVRDWAKRQVEKSLRTESEIPNSPLSLSLDLARPEAPINGRFTIYFNQWKNLTIKKYLTIDLSRGDFAVSCRLLKQGYTNDDVINAIINCSQNIAERKMNYVNRYAKRTVEAALKAILSTPKK